MRVLITGAAGYIGRNVVPALEQEHELRLADIQPIDDPRYVPLDLVDPVATREAVAEVDAILHLATSSGFEGSVENDAANRERFAVNVEGTHNLLAAAAAAGVRRVVHTSSIMVTWGYPPPGMIAGDAPAWPVGTYAVTKHLGEILCQHFSQRAGLSIVCMRIAKPIAIDDPYWKNRRVRPQTLPFPDLIQAYSRALLVDSAGCQTVTVVGESSRRRWSLAEAKQVLGYEPQVRLEDLGFVLGDEREPLE